MLFVAELVLVTWVSLLPGSMLPGSIQFWDKAQHALEFSGLTLTGSLAYIRNPMGLALGLMIYGALIEVSQSGFTTTRCGELNDWYADVVGMLIGCLLAYLLSVLRNLGAVRL